MGSRIEQIIEEIEDYIDSCKFQHGPDTLMEFSTKTQSVDAMYSQNALINYQMNDKAKMEYDLLQDILNLCSVYY